MLDNANRTTIPDHPTILTSSSNNYYVAIRFFFDLDILSIIGCLYLLNALHTSHFISVLLIKEKLGERLGNKEYTTLAKYGKCDSMK